ncbi:MAG: UDP-N-acetylmuramate dehydrogenase, partial [Rhodocyclaceae bacterium]|nr:UDP-N-acetylmuramate dehydrogenase [Rhodocyclaceae bacterium]
ALRGELRFNEPMARHVSWRAGGAAARAYFPADLDDLAAFLRATRIDEPLLFVGLGSNLLVRDGGFDGTVVFLHAVLRRLTLAEPGLVYAEAGVASPKVARFAANHGLAGAEFLAGIPGAVGGALAMNAGCHGGETWGIVERVLMLDRNGALREARGSRFRNRLSPCRPARCGGRMLRRRLVPPAGRGRPQPRAAASATCWKKRIASQPLQWPNAGSVFRNPPDDHAARLIEAAGLKGLQIGGAHVSEKHANFIVNRSGGRRRPTSRR